jgi:hypothetical protein
MLRCPARKGTDENLELADRGAKGVQVAPPGLRVPDDEPAVFMSKDYVTVREGGEG